MAPTTQGNVGAAGHLDIEVLRAIRPKRRIYKARTFITPWGRFSWSRDKGEGPLFGFNSQSLQSHLTAVHRDGDHGAVELGKPELGKVLGEYDLGSGLVTNLGAQLLCRDRLWVAFTTPFSTLSSVAGGGINYHTTGTGATAAAQTDFGIQTPVASGNLTGATNLCFTGAQSTVAPNIYQTIATVVYGGAGGGAITEWALQMSNAATITRTATGAGGANTSFTDSGGSFTTTGMKNLGWSLLGNATVANTPTTLVAQLVENTTSGTVLVIAAGPDSTHWYTLAMGSGAFIGAAAYVLAPTTFDRKVFGVITTGAGDSIQFTYQLTAQAGN